VTQNLQKRVRTAFPVGLDPDSRKEALDYFKSLGETRKDLAQNLNRSALLLVATVVIFELLSSSKAKQVNLVGFTFEDLSLIHKLLPALIAYTFFELVIASVRYRENLNLNFLGMRQLQRNLTDNDLYPPLLPPTRAFFTMLIRLSPANTTPYSIWRDRCLILLSVPIILLVPVGFCIRAYINLFQRYGLSSIVTWTSLGFAFYLLTAGYVLFFLAVNENE